MLSSFAVPSTTYWLVAVLVWPLALRVRKPSLTVACSVSSVLPAAKLPKSPDADILTAPATLSETVKPVALADTEMVGSGGGGGDAGTKLTNCS